MKVETVDFLAIPTRDWNPESDGEEFKPHLGGFGVRVADVEEARRELEAKGVEFMGDTFDSSVCHMGFFKDPDGNVVILHRRYAPRVAR